MSSCIGSGVNALPEVPCAASASPAMSDFRQLYTKHFDEVMTFVLRFGLNHYDAEDLTQRVFMVALRHCAEQGPLVEARHWLRAVALRLIHQHFRWWRVRYAAKWLITQTWAGVDENDISPERETSASESLREVREILGRMSTKLRDTLVLLDIDGTPPREAAELLGIPRNTIRSRHRLARSQFKRLWDSAQKQRSQTHV